jgi:hypothetical protein
MAHAFQPIPANPAFRKLRESTYASDYITNKKGLIVYCNEKKNFGCKRSWNQSNYLLYNNGQSATNNLLSSKFNTSELFSNLVTKENLLDVPVIMDANNYEVPTNIVHPTCIEPFYHRYIIDPDGVLFGKTLCGFNNYANFMEPSLQ